MFFSYKLVYDWRFSVIVHSCLDSTSGCNCPCLEIVSDYKYLGIFIDDGLSWRAQSRYLQSRLRRLNYLLYYLAKFVVGLHLRRFYVAIYESVLRYGLAIWGGCADYFTEPVKVLQKRAVRCAAGLDWDAPSALAFGQLHLFDFEKLYSLELGCGFLRYGRGVQQPPNWKKYHSRMQFGFRSISFYLSLPEPVRLSSRRRFRKALRLWLLGDYIDPE